MVDRRVLSSLAYVCAALSPTGAAQAAAVLDVPIMLGGDLSWSGSLGQGFSINTPVSIDASETLGDGRFQSAIFDASGAKNGPNPDVFCRPSVAELANAFQSSTPWLLTSARYPLTLVGLDALDPPDVNLGRDRDDLGGCATGAGSDDNESPYGASATGIDDGQSSVGHADGFGPASWQTSPFGSDFNNIWALGGGATGAPGYGFQSPGPSASGGGSDMPSGLTSAPPPSSPPAESTPGQLPPSQGGGGTGNLLSSDAASAVPEPAAWVLMVAGLGGLGVALRARRRALRSAEGL